jgi:MFS family permease
MERTLKSPSFTALLAGTFVSNVGGWAQKVATAWAIYQTTGSAAWLGVDVFVGGMTTVLLLPLGGVLADRYDRRMLVAVGNVLLGLIALSLAMLAWAGWLGPWWIVAASGFSGVVLAGVAPASASLLPDLVGETALSRAVAINSLQFNLARAVGPVAGGWLMIAGGPAWCFLANAVSFAVVSAVLLCIRVPARKITARQSIIVQIRTAAAFAWQDPTVGRLLLLILTTAFAAAPVVTMLPTLAETMLSGSAMLYASLLASFGVGACIAGILGALRKQPKPVWRWALISATACLAAQALLAVAVQALNPVAIATSVGLVGGAGLAFVWTMIQSGSALLMATPAELRGRVSSLQQMCFRVGQPMGGLAAGIALEITSAPWVFAGFGIVGTCVLLKVAYSSHRR